MLVMTECIKVLPKNAEIIVKNIKEIVPERDRHIPANQKTLEIEKTLKIKGKKNKEIYYQTQELCLYLNKGIKDKYIFNYFKFIV